MKLFLICSFNIIKYREIIYKRSNVGKHLIWAY